MRIEMWSDVVCPFCFLGLRRLQAAVVNVGLEGELDLHIRSFELNPNAPAAATGTIEEHLAKKYGMSLEQAHAANDSLRQQGEPLGIDFRFDRAVRANTFDAHRLIHLAATHDLALNVKERLLRAYFTDGETISDHLTLARIGVDAGLDRTEVAEMLVGDEFAAEVRADEDAALDLGVTGVPYFLIDGALAVAGAQPTEVFERALQRAAARSAP